MYKCYVSLLKAKSRDKITSRIQPYMKGPLFWFRPSHDNIFPERWLWPGLLTPSAGQSWKCCCIKQDIYPPTITSTAGVSNIRPRGQNRPLKTLPLGLLDYILIHFTACLTDKHFLQSFILHQSNTYVTEKFFFSQLLHSMWQSCCNMLRMCLNIYTFLQRFNLIHWNEHVHVS